MKRVFTLIIAVLVTVVLSAQNFTRSYPVSSFTGINAGGVFDITLVKGSSNTVTITSDKEISQYVEVKVKSGVLYLNLDTDKMPNSIKRRMKYIEANISIKQLEKIYLSGAARLSSSGLFNPATFKGDFSGAVVAKGLNINSQTATFYASGASRIDIKGKFQSVKYDISGASKVTIDQDATDVTLGGSGASVMDYSGKSTIVDVSISGATHVSMKGSATTANFEASGASVLNAEDFIVKDVDIEVSGVSQVRANVTGSISAEISGGSVVNYSGSPVVKKIETSSQGSFKRIGSSN
ncbi:MAG: DUF2807 domain-containing protein [Bacteroidales bacterium]|jgi:hypothetical protein|nr:DUF2807 domain-containing protein [Bacteroidales bacterium]MDD3272485.1 DUF2807 domain-containing protein [Bacteroidales bacterium]MDD4057323.1 DUF2807 domain-containing protein [Bacteroidales bacterium]